MRDSDHLLRRRESAAHEVFDTDMDVRAHLSCVLTTFVRVLHRHPFDAEDLRHQRRRPGHGPALLSPKDRDELVLLLLRRFVIYQYAQVPVAIDHHLRCVANQADRESGYVGALDVAAIDVEDEQEVAPGV